MIDVLDTLPILEKVGKKKDPLTSQVQVDEYTSLACQPFDYEFNGESVFFPFKMPKKIPKEFNIGLIVGASGSGKSTLLKEFGVEEDIEWDKDKAIVSHFESPEDAVNRLSAVGLNSVPTWCKPYHVLSTGEKFRGDMARRIKDNAVVDEFTSVVDRTVAKACSNAIHKYIKREDIKNVVFCGCHYDVVEWLRPDWIFDANTKTLYDGRLLRRPSIECKIHEGLDKQGIWEMFKDFHYLSASYNKAARTYALTWDDKLIGMTGVIPMPSGTVKNAWRGHRTVLHPDYQGLGIGSRLSDVIGQIYVDMGLKYYSRSAHIRFGRHRDNSTLWEATGTSGKLRKGVNETAGPMMKYDDKRVCFSHQYVGEKFRKPHLRVVFDFSEDYMETHTYEDFKVTMDRIVKRLDKYYIIFYSGAFKVVDTYAERYTKENGCRNELFPKSKIEKGKPPLHRVCDVVLMFGENKELEELCKANGKVKYHTYS